MTYQYSFLCGIVLFSQQLFVKMLHGLLHVSSCFEKLGMHYALLNLQLWKRKLLLLCFLYHL